MKINETSTNEKDSTYLIAEIGVNHFDIAENRGITPMAAAKEMIREAVTAGVDAVKFQSYSAETLASEKSPAYWDTDEEPTDSQYDLFAQYDDFNASDFENLAEWTRDNFDADFLSTPFDSHAVEYLEEIVPAYKVASADITNLPLLKEIAKKSKPILLSTGASSIGEIDTAVRTIREAAPESEIALLHCILEYPTPRANANLGMINHLDAAFPEHTVGYSDHVPPDEGMVTLLNASVQGAEIIEKHFTLNKSLEGNDHYHAMDPSDVRTFRRNESVMIQTTGESTKRPISSESDSRTHARRSIVAASDIAQGEVLTREQLALKRPGTGIQPSMLDVVVGRTASTKIEADEIITWDQV